MALAIAVVVLGPLLLELCGIVVAGIVGFIRLCIPFVLLGVVAVVVLYGIYLIMRKTYLDNIVFSVPFQGRYAFPFH